MAAAESYKEWRAAAIAHDKKSGVVRWKTTDESEHFDYVSIRRRLKRLRRLRAAGDNAGVLCALYGKAKYGTKKLIVDYVDEVVSALEMLASHEADDIPLEERLDFFRRARHCFGCTAFMMSGAGSLLFFHIGVAKAMWLEGVLPDILSGSSGGAIVGGLVSTQSDETLEDIFEPENLVHEIERDAGLLKHLAVFRPEVVSAGEVREVIERLIPDLTFQEAYEKTERHLNVSIAAAEKHQTSRLLNSITTPNVYVREAILASAAVPGFFPPVALAAKNYMGERQAYMPSRKWVDGSLSDDLPAKRLSRIYGVNHFIVSQVNPHVFPFVSDSRRGTGILSTVKSVSGRTAREWLNAGAALFDKPLSWNPTINRLTNVGLGIINQDYIGDINILPDTRLFNPLKLLSHRSVKEILGLIRMGERATWPKIEMIRIQTKISRTLDDILRDLDHYPPHIRSTTKRRAS